MALCQKAAWWRSLVRCCVNSYFHLCLIRNTQWKQLICSIIYSRNTPRSVLYPMNHKKVNLSTEPVRNFPEKSVVILQTYFTVLAGSGASMKQPIKWSPLKFSSDDIKGEVNYYLWTRQARRKLFSAVRCFGSVAFPSFTMLHHVPVCDCIKVEGKELRERMAGHKAEPNPMACARQQCSLHLFVLSGDSQNDVFVCRVCVVDFFERDVLKTHRAMPAPAQKRKKKSHLDI